jgi:hypothetical protein
VKEEEEEEEEENGVFLVLWRPLDILYAAVQYYSPQTRKVIRHWTNVGTGETGTQRMDVHMSAALDLRGKIFSCRVEETKARLWMAVFAPQLQPFTKGDNPKP